MIIIFVAVLFVCVSPKTLPPEIRKCSRSDPNLAKCLQEVVPDAIIKFAAGNRELGIVPLDPLVIPKIELGSSDSGSVAVHQIYENMKLYGLTKGTIYDSDVSISDDDCHWRFKSKIDEFRVECDYKMDGKILVFPINGHGKCNNTFYDLQSDYDAKCERFMKNNKKYLRVTHFAFKNAPKRVVFNFENIIDGNELLSREVLKALNENALTLYAEVGSAIDEAMGQIWKDTINHVYTKIPEDELFLP